MFLFNQINVFVFILYCFINNILGSINLYKSLIYGKKNITRYLQFIKNLCPWSAEQFEKLG